MDILVTVEGQLIKLAANQSRHIEGSSKFVKFTFDFSNEWDGLTKTAWFVQNNKGYTEIFTGNSVYLPSSVKQGECKMALRGVSSNNTTKIATTNYIALDIEKDITNVSAVASDEALMKLFDEKIAALIAATDTDVAREALAAAVAATAGVDIEHVSASVSASTDEAERYKNEAAASATQAEESASKVASAVIAANKALEEATALKQATQEVIGENGTSVSPKDGSALKIIRDSKSEVKTARDETIAAKEAILGSDGGGGYKSELDAIRTDTINAKNQIIGTDGTSGKPEENSALWQVLKAKNIIVGEDGSTGAKKEVLDAKTEILGEDGTSSNPSANSTLKDIRLAKNYIIGENTETNTYTYANPSDDSALDEIRKAKGYIVGSESSDTYDNPNPESALKIIKDAESSAIESKNAAATSENNAKLSEDNAKESEINAAVSEENAKLSADNAATSETNALNAKTEIVGESGSADLPSDNSALGQIKYIKNEIFGAGGTSTSPVTGSSLSDIRLAKGYIVGESAEDTAALPSDESALGQVIAAKNSAANSAKIAQEAAASANHGITVVPNLDSDSTSDALSASMGKHLNETKLNLGGGTMTGDLTLKGEPTSDNMAATKKYVDDHVPTYDGEVTNKDDDKSAPSTKAVNEALDGKVDKVDGKQLTKNDFTDEFKTKLEGIKDGANKTIVDDALSTESTNPVQNKVVAAALNDKVEKIQGKSLSTNDYTTEEKNKLSGIDNNANNYVHPEKHPATIITEDETHRFVSDDDKASLADIITRLAGLKFVVSNSAPTDADENTVTIVISE